MIYAKISNSKIVQYPVYEGDIRLLYPHISFGVNFEPPADFVEVVDTTRPTELYDEVVSEGTPLLTNGVWSRNWITSKVSSDELDLLKLNKWTEVRTKRSFHLSQCDWTQMVDSPLTQSQKTLWATYRQALRDITKQTDPFNIVWPTPPE